MPQNPPVTNIRTSHGITIQTASGVIIGFITNFTPAQGKAVTPAYELNAITSGRPIENVPGNVSGLSLDVSRYDIYPRRMEEAFGTDDFEMLTDQNVPFTVQEITRIPGGDGETFTTEVRQYTGCWFTSIGRSFRADDTRIIMVSARMVYLSKERLQ